ncbi:MAG: MBL fold metallo-hydrolase [Acidobacteriota bacterium]
MFIMTLPFIFAMTTATATYEKDVIHTSAGDVEITFLGHSSLILTHNGKHIYTDPYGDVADYSEFPKADLILVTHDHFDHLDMTEIEKISGTHTQIVTTALGAKKVPGAVVMKNGDTRTIGEMQIEAVPAYNIKHLRDGRNPFHPKGDGNGYILKIGETRLYFAGDTEDIPEMANLKSKQIDIAFLPMNLPYTMNPAMTARAARMVMPKVLYPYHTGETDTSLITKLLKDTPEIEVRIRHMK